MVTKRITAAELAAKLAVDPAYQARVRERDAELGRRAAECAADERLMVAEIRRLGYDIDSVWDLVNNAPHAVLKRRFVGPYPRAYPVLVRHLSVDHTPAVREGVIRALTVRDGGVLVEAALLAEFEREQRPPLRWVLANALRIAMPYSKRRRRPEIAEAYRGGSGA